MKKMDEVNEIILDGYSIYIEHLEQLDQNTNTHDTGILKKNVIELTAQGIEQTIKPIISILNTFRTVAKDSLPNETELSLQLEVCLKGETPVLKIVGAESSAQIGVKFIWKNESN